ncbi:MAG TPA: Ppx/GppA family phosphatase [Oscillatoriales cyanobacterium M59_W2019_021]|nr:MAG: Ppx/GppA family phosphatase [Cyanobacteria bacterium J055]HIK33184.1 Ppx/GppA family phosphatase [Oscillatoriales cyanobacterium M4454_W2019_049]HIK53031.1 Ppx/GppA family phosphatase [Oscillatoriales cyanobacterium M59_W2019_021]
MNLELQSAPALERLFPNSQTEPMLAAIDIGTNSVHMVVVKIQPDLPAFRIVAREKETVRLGDRDRESGNLKPEVMKKAIAALGRFQDIARHLEVERIIAVATSATREAPNGTEFLQQIKSELGLSVSLISGQEEARRIYLGILSGMELHGQPHVAIDIGGGSTELILGDGREPRSLSSTKVGAVRLTGEFVSTDPISSTEFQYLQAYIRGMLERPVEELQAHLQPGEIPQLIGTSGTIECLAQIHARQTLGMAPSRLHGYEFSLTDLRSIVKKLRKLTHAERLAVPGISERRAEIILAGALILQEAMTLLGIDSIRVCERSLREGVIVDWMLMRGLIEDRLSYQSSIRQRSTLLIAQKYGVNLAHARRVANFALNLFDLTQGSLHPWQARERQLLWSAAILHNCGIYVSHSSHHKHSYYLIRNGELLGYTEMDIETIAQIARYHRKSPPKKSHETYQVLPKKQQQIVAQLSALLRLATALDRRQIGAVSRIDGEYRERVRELWLLLHPTNPEDTCELELWSLDYKKEVFEAEFGVKLMAVLGET